MDATGTPASPKPLRRRIAAAIALCAASPLILPALPAAALAGHLAWVARRRRRWAVLILGLSLAALSLAAGTVAFVLAMDAVLEPSRQWAFLSFAEAVRIYTEKHGQMPPDLATLERTGLFGGDYRRPRWGWRLRHGARPAYLPVSDLDGRRSYIVAVEAHERDEDGHVFYVYMKHLGEDAWDFKKGRARDRAELARLLRADDALRKETGQPGRWADLLPLSAHGE